MKQRLQGTHTQTLGYFRSHPSLSASRTAHTQSAVQPGWRRRRCSPGAEGPGTSFCLSPRTRARNRPRDASFYSWRKPRGPVIQPHIQEEGEETASHAKTKTLSFPSVNSPYFRFTSSNLVHIRECSLPRETCKHLALFTPLFIVWPVLGSRECTSHSRNKCLRGIASDVLRKHEMSASITNSLLLPQRRSQRAKVRVIKSERELALF